MEIAKQESRKKKPIVYAPPDRMQSDFVLSERSKRLHDCSCQYLSHLRHYQYVDDLEECLEWKPCKKCYEKMVFRYGIRDWYNYNRYQKFFQKNPVAFSVFHELFITNCAKMYMVNSEIRIWCNHDDWVLDMESCNGNIKLMHNNYVRSMSGKRYIVKGYHRQNISPQSVQNALKHIMWYDYEIGHVNQKEPICDKARKQKAEIPGIITCESASQLRSSAE